MCGILFSKSSGCKISRNAFQTALNSQAWRGPDGNKISEEKNSIWLGHVRLSILGLDEESNQPMLSSCGRYKIIYNGEIYNHLELREQLGLKCKTTCDTETIVEAFSKIGIRSFDLLDGMFAFVIIEVHTGRWWATRDKFGIKPLFIFRDGKKVILSSETISIRSLIECTVSEESIEEWKVIRRPIPGKTFFNEIDEVLPGSILCDGKLVSSLDLYSKRIQNDYEDDEIFEILRESVHMHELSEVDNVCLLSGGIDSSIIAAISSVKTTYSVGLINNNEIEEATDTARKLSKEISSLKLSEADLISAWKYLIKLRGEPLSVPNEGLIYSICSSMKKNEKVVLTGEGADELFFGYDRIFREAALNKKFNKKMFYEMYGYSKNIDNCKRLDSYIDNLMFGKSNINFLEDYFIETHLTGLLRRMDMSSMAASKEARVPFVAKKVFEYMYRQPMETKISENFSKIPLRNLCEKLSLYGPLHRKKIGFSSTFTSGGRYQEYNNFRKMNLEELGWL